VLAMVGCVGYGGGVLVHCGGERGGPFTWYLGSWRWLLSLTGPATVPLCPFETFLLRILGDNTRPPPIHSACRIDAIYQASETFNSRWTPLRHLLPILVAVQPVVTMHHSDGDGQCQRGQGPILVAFL
jgi:hypothetical protein